MPLPHKRLLNTEPHSFPVLDQSQTCSYFLERFAPNIIGQSELGYYSKMALCKRLTKHSDEAFRGIFDVQDFRSSSEGTDSKDCDREGIFICHLADWLHEILDFKYQALPLVFDPRGLTTLQYVWVTSLLFC